MIIIILILGFILRAINLNQSFWLDEAITATIARDLTIGEIFSQYLPLDNHPPLYLLMINFLFSFLPNNEIVARLPSVIFGVLLIFLAYLLTKELFNKTIADVASLLVATSPLLIYYSQEARMYMLNALLVAAIILFFIKYLKNSNKNFLIPYTFLSILLIYTDYLPYLIFLVLNIAVLFYKKLNKWWVLSQIIIIVSFLPWLPLFIKQIFLGVSSRGVSEIFDLILGKFTYKSLPITLEKFTLGRIPIPEDYTAILIALPVILFLALTLKGFKETKEQNKLVLSLWIIIPLSLGLFLSFFIPVFQYFRFIFVLPPIYILIALGIFSFKKVLKFIFLTVVIIINVLATFVYYLDPSLQREDWKGAIGWSLENVGDGKILFASSSPLPSYIWYRKYHPEAEGAFRGFYADSNDKQKVKLLISKKGKILVYVYLQDITDPDRNLQKWIEEENFKKTGSNAFIGVGEVQIYEK